MTLVSPEVGLGSCEENLPERKILQVGVPVGQQQITEGFKMLYRSHSRLRLVFNMFIKRIPTSIVIYHWTLQKLTGRV